MSIIFHSTVLTVLVIVAVAWVSVLVTTGILLSFILIKERRGGRDRR